MLFESSVSFIRLVTKLLILCVCSILELDGLTVKVKITTGGR